MNALDQQPRLFLISGSTRRPSYTRALVEVVAEMLVMQGAQTEHWSLADRPLAIADPRFHRDPTLHSDAVVRRFVSYAADCDGFILATPIYHNSLSGVLKNALDHLSIEQFKYKPVGLLSHGGNRSTQAADHLRVVVRGLWGVTTPTQVCTSSTDFRSTDDGMSYELVSDDINQRLARFCKEFIVFSTHFRFIREHLATD